MRDENLEALREFLAENGDASQQHLDTLDALIARTTTLEERSRAVTRHRHYEKVGMEKLASDIDALAAALSTTKARQHSSAGPDAT